MKSNPSDLVAVRWGGVLKRYPGYVLGFRQPSLTCQIRVHLSEGHLSEETLAWWAGQLGLSAVSAPSSGPAADVGAGWVQALAHLAAAWQRQCRIPVAEGCRVASGPTDPSGWRTYHLSVPFVHRDAASLCLEGLIQALSDMGPAHDPTALATWRRDMHQRLQRYSEPGANRYSIVWTAARLGIPVAALNRQVLVLGHGHRARWMKSTITDQTSAIGVGLALNKMQTADLLRQAGLPGAVHQRVASADEAVATAQQWGYPVVIKPADQEQGRGVAADLRSEAQVREAFAAASAVSQQILVERWQAGQTHRLTVFHGRVFRVTQRWAGGVMGDGQHSIAALVALKQQTALSQRRAAYQDGTPLLSLDAEALSLLAQSQRTVDDIPRAGDYIRLRRRDNINAGGDNVKLSPDQVHPDNRRLAEDAALLLKLDIAGIDFITTDITRSWRDIGGLICEINAQPQLGATSHADAYPDMLGALLPDGGRIPVQLLLCPDDAALHSRVVQQAATRWGAQALSSRHGLWIDGAWRTTAFANGFAAAVALLKRPDVQQALCLMSPVEVLTYGSPTPYLDKMSTLEADTWPASERLRLPAVGALVQPYVSAAPGLRSVTKR